MAGRKRGRKRVRTAAQRAQLKKAQAASARKRRRRRVGKNVGIGLRVAGSFAGTIASYHVVNYGRKPQLLKKHYKAVKSYRGQRKVAKLTPGIGSGYNPRYI